MQLLNLNEYVEYQKSTRSSLWFTPSEGATPAQARLEREIEELKFTQSVMTFFVQGARVQPNGELRVLVG